MDRSILGSLGRLLRALAGLALLATTTVAPARAGEAGSACGLLTVAELEEAIGGKAEKPPSGGKQAIPGAMTLDECSVVLRGTGQPHPVSLRVDTDLGMDGADAIRARNTGTAMEPQWKTEGARLEQANVGSAICILAGRPSVASHTTCSVPRGKGYVELDVTGSVDELPSMATVGALVQKAVGRH